ncbi:baculoviral IAP repeat-containing protein 7 isoform X4 [Dendrobates tinctorius]|uniref:baculoviral IAP repeat-containing protein 7 isoform X4 n=1 Tax=Dendrobates tinctorius TaxID=92724 RepID=UPI003CCA5F84
MLWAGRRCFGLCYTRISPVVMSCWYWDSSPLAEHRAQCRSRVDLSMEGGSINRILVSWRPSAMVPEPPAVVKPSMCCEASRLRTLAVWPGPSSICPRDLARAGFYYLGPGDRVQCFCCGGVLRCWEPGDEPQDEHHKFFPSCPFVLGREVGNIPRAGGNDSVDGQIIGQLQRFPEEEEVTLLAMYPELVEERDRLATYCNWPPYAEVTPEVLAQAGFFYTGHRDNVKCFHCDGGLRNWESGDDPWREHAKWFPRCEFLIHSMGLAYVRGVQDTSFSPESTVSSPESQRSEDRSLGSRSDFVRIPEAPSQRATAEPQPPKEPEHSLSTEEQLRRLKEERMCKVCLDKDVSMVFVPCGHLVVCMDCAPNLRHCPICRASIRGSVRAFMS